MRHVRNGKVHRLRTKLKQGDRFRRVLVESNLPPFETAAPALEPINDVLIWVDEVRGLLELVLLRVLGYDGDYWCRLRLGRSARMSRRCHGLPRP
jgi:hypothetical protein